MRDFFVDDFKTKRANLRAQMSSVCVRVSPYVCVSRRVADLNDTGLLQLSNAGFHLYNSLTVLYG